MRTFNLGSVHLGMPVHGTIPPQTVISLVATCEELTRRGVPHRLMMNVGNSLLTEARALVVDNFLHTDEQYLFFLDADLSWQAEDFLKILALTTTLGCVCGAYPVKDDSHRYFLAVEKEVVVNEEGCLPILGTGLGFTCVKRSLIEQLAAQAPKVMTTCRDHPIANVFRIDTDKGWFRGEDHAFFADLRALGQTVWLEPDVQLGHLGLKEYTAPSVRASLKQYLKA